MTIQHITPEELAAVNPFGLLSALSAARLAALSRPFGSGDIKTLTGNKYVEWDTVLSRLHHVFGPRVSTRPFTVDANGLNSALFTGHLSPELKNQPSTEVVLCVEVIIWDDEHSREIRVTGVGGKIYDTPKKGIADTFKAAFSKAAKNASKLLGVQLDGGLDAEPGIDFEFDPTQAPPGLYGGLTPPPGLGGPPPAPPQASPQAPSQYTPPPVPVAAQTQYAPPPAPPAPAQQYAPPPAPAPAVYIPPQAPAPAAYVPPPAPQTQYAPPPVPPEYVAPPQPPQAQAQYTPPAAPPQYAPPPATQPVPQPQYAPPPAAAPQPQYAPPPAPAQYAPPPAAPPQYAPPPAAPPTQYAPPPAPGPVAPPPAHVHTQPSPYTCSRCNGPIYDATDGDGNFWTAQEVYETTISPSSGFGRAICVPCLPAMNGTAGQPAAA